MDIRRIDPDDEARLREVWQLSKASDEHERPWATFQPWEAARVGYRPNESRDQWSYLAVEDGILVGAAVCGLPLLDNTASAGLDVHVRPDRRREGTGSALLARMTADLERAGRSLLVAEVNTPVEGEVSAGVRFAERHGFGVGIVDDHRFLDLDDSRERWSELAAGCAPHHADYRLVTWHDVVPPEHLPGYCALQHAFNAEAPAGDLELENEHWDEDRVRGKEARWRAAGRYEVVTAAIAPDGTMAGLSEVMVAEQTPTYGMQGGTLVLPEHRGHRLGLALKLANQQAVVDRFPGCRSLHTWNAGVNAHMNAINDALGFTTVERLYEMQRKL